MFSTLFLSFSVLLCVFLFAHFNSARQVRKKKKNKKQNRRNNFFKQFAVFYKPKVASNSQISGMSFFIYFSIFFWNLFSFCSSFLCRPSTYFPLVLSVPTSSPTSQNASSERRTARSNSERNSNAAIEISGSNRKIRANVFNANDVRGELNKSFETKTPSVRSLKLHTKNFALKKNTFFSFQLAFTFFSTFSPRKSLQKHQCSKFCEEYRFVRHFELQQILRKKNSGAFFFFFFFFFFFEGRV